MDLQVENCSYIALQQYIRANFYLSNSVLQQVDGDATRQSSHGFVDLRLNLASARRERAVKVNINVQQHGVPWHGFRDVLIKLMHATPPEMCQSRSGKCTFTAHECSGTEPSPQPPTVPYLY
ncbi:hypothetical protein J6590_019214 [Homalodisca vitripennis]|nr:hypothetical protein J6590_019214 [Homalodisca vitripennis]